MPYPRSRSFRSRQLAAAAVSSSLVVTIYGASLGTTQARREQHAVITSSYLFISHHRPRALLKGQYEQDFSKKILDHNRSAPVVYLTCLFVFLQYFRFQVENFLIFSLEFKSISSLISVQMRPMKQQVMKEQNYSPVQLDSEQQVISTVANSY